MVKRYNFVSVSGPNGIITGYDMDEWDNGQYVEATDYFALQAALREALDGWRYAEDDAILDPRIAALRKEFLDDS